MNEILDLVPIWTFILALAVFFYVLLDGFDLGVGMLYGLAPDTPSRNTIMNSIAPIWDGNETWLILGGLGLLAAFPLAFAIIIPAVYFPILVMLLALVFRGVAFEFRFRDADNKTFWDHAFCYGSAIATFAQGVVLGAFSRNVVQLSDAVLSIDWRGVSLRLRPLRGRLAYSEDRRRGPSCCAPLWPHLPHWRSCRDWHCQYLDPPDESGCGFTLVLVAKYRAACASTACYGGCWILYVARAE
jgi:hypothetical protein